MGREVNTAVGAAVLAAAGATLADPEQADARPVCGEVLPECAPPTSPVVTPPADAPARKPPPRKPNLPASEPQGQGTPGNAGAPGNAGGTADPPRVGRQPTPHGSQKFPDLGPARRTPARRKPNLPASEPQGQGTPGNAGAPGNAGGTADPPRVGRQPTPHGSQKFPDLGPARRTSGPRKPPRETPDPAADDPWADHFDAGGPGADPGDPVQPTYDSWQDMYTAPMGLDPKPARTRTPARNPAESPEDARRRVNRVLRRLRSQAGDDNPWASFYTQPIQAPVKPAPAPRTLRDMDPKERDEAILNPLTTPMFTDAQREGARQRQERAAARKLRGTLRRQVVRDVGRSGALPELLVGPMDLGPRDIDDPVLRDVLCVADGLRRCRRDRALTQLELDVLREAGILTRADDPNPGRRDSEWFKQRKRQHRQEAIEELEARQPAAEEPLPEFSWGGFMGGAWEHGKGLAVSSFQRSPAGLVTNPKEFFRENWNFAKGAGEGFKGIWDTGVMGWHMSPVGCQVDPEGCARQYDELEQIFDYAKKDPKRFAYVMALSAANYEDLSEGRYSEWAGNFTPDAILAALTYGSGAAATGGMRGVRVLDDLPVPPRARGLLNGLDPSAIRRIDASPGALDELVGMLVNSSSGVGRRRYLPTRVSGGAGEVGTWRGLVQRPDVRRVYRIPETNEKGKRTPDYVFEGVDGRLTRVETTVVSVGRGRGYRPRRKVRAQNPSASAIASRINGKIKQRVTQFNSPVTVNGRQVPEGGELSLHLRRASRVPGTRQSRAMWERVGDDAMAAAREAIERSRADLLKAKVRVVEVKLGGRTVRYRITPSGPLVVL